MDLNWEIPKVLQAAAVATGNGNAMAINGRGGVAVNLTIATTATVTFEATMDGTNWYAVKAVNRTTETAATTATASGIFFVSLPGCLQFRARISAWTSGNVDATGTAVPVTSL